MTADLPPAPPHDPLEVLAAGFVERLRRGECPSVEDCARQHPDLAADIRELFPVLLLMERDGPKAPASAVTLAQLGERLERAGLMSAGEFDGWLAAFGERPRPADAVPAAAELVRARRLTPFQASALCEPEPPVLVLGDYLLLDRLGAGGMGVVFKALHRRMRRTVALKVLPLTSLRHPEALRRFQREVEAVARLIHPNVTTAYDAGEHGGVPFLVLEYVDGPDLASLIREQGPLSIPEAVDAIIQAARGLFYAHEMGVVHRDVKPSNLLRDRHGMVKVLDLGLARVYSDLRGDDGGAAPADSGRPREESQTATGAGVLLGTPQFMAPEQARDAARADHRADVYSLGCTLFYLLTGRAPYPAETVAEAIRAHRESPVPSLRSLRPDVSPALDALFQRMAAKEPAARPQSMAEIVAAPGRLAAGLARGSRRRPARRLWTVALAAAAVLTLGVLGVLFLRPESSPPTNPSPPQDRSPLDQLSREAIPPYELRVAGGGDPERAPAELVAVLGDSRLKHWGFVDGVAFSPDGTALASASWDGTVKVWDPATGEERLTLDGGGAWLHAVAFSPDGKSLAAGDRWGQVTLWDWRAGSKETTIKVGDKKVVALSFSPDGKTLAVADLASGNQIRLWDTASGRQGPPIEGHTGKVRSLAFLPDGRLFSGGLDNTVRIWDLETREERPKLPRGHRQPVHAVAVSPDGRRVASGEESGLIKLADPATGAFTVNLLQQPHAVTALAFSPDGATLASAGPDGVVRLWNVTTKEKTRELRGHEDRVSSLAFSPDGKTLASGGIDHSVRLWDPSTGEPRLASEGHPGKVRCAAFAPDGSVVAGGVGGEVMLWDPQARTARSLYTHPRGVARVAVAPDGSRVGSVGLDGGMRVWERFTGREPAIFGRASGYLWAVGFSADGKWLAWGGANRVIKLCEAETGRDGISFRGHEAPVNCLAFHPEEMLLASGDGNQFTGEDQGTVKVWDATTGEARLTLPNVSGAITSVAFHPKGTMLAATGFWHRLHPEVGVRIWDARSGQPLRTLTGHSHASLWAEFSPDDHSLASSGADGTVRVWEPQTGAAGKTFRLGPPLGHINQVSFSADGRHLATANGNGTISILRLSTLPESP
jgi:WD40 repeat protein/serine/threonine protein kinase